MGGGGRTGGAGQRASEGGDGRVEGERPEGAWGGARLGARARRPRPQGRGRAGEGRGSGRSAARALPDFPAGRRVRRTGPARPAPAGCALGLRGSACVVCASAGLVRVAGACGPPPSRRTQPPPAASPSFLPSRTSGTRRSDELEFESRALHPDTPHLPPTRPSQGTCLPALDFTFLIWKMGFKTNSSYRAQSVFQRTNGITT